MNVSLEKRNRKLKSRPNFSCSVLGAGTTRAAEWRSPLGCARFRSVGFACQSFGCEFISTFFEILRSSLVSIHRRVPPFASSRRPVVAKPHFPWTKIVISSNEKRRSSRSLPGPFAAEQPADASYLSRVVRCAPASDEAPRGPNWQSIINRRTRRPKFHDERPATPRCLSALPTEASSFPY